MSYSTMNEVEELFPQRQALNLELLLKEWEVEQFHPIS
jgi:hypothetical protein